MLTKSSCDRFAEQKPTKKALVFGHTDSIKVSLTTTEASKAKRPHQAFLVLTEETGLEAPYPLTIKASGKGSVEIVCDCLPVDAAPSLT